MKLNSGPGWKTARLPSSLLADNSADKKSAESCGSITVIMLLS
jgi:hypothetical protein